MKRAGFTMIELIFVIVILGILAAVAVPKMGETATSAKVQNIESFVGTLNRTVGASMWAKALRNTNDTIGSVKGSQDTFNITDYIDLPDEIQPVSGSDETDLLQQCADANETTWVAVMEVQSGTFPGVQFKDDAGANLGSAGTLQIFCRDGSSVEQPRFAFSDDGNTTKLGYEIN
jgi:prepilin-type N-terminal cleavage/methylation domain-containing protein